MKWGHCPMCGRRTVTVEVWGDDVVLDARDYYFDARQARNAPRVYANRVGVIEPVFVRAIVGPGRDGPYKRPHSDVCERKGRR